MFSIQYSVVSAPRSVFRVQRPAVWVRVVGGSLVGVIAVNLFSPSNSYRVLLTPTGSDGLRREV